MNTTNNNNQGEQGMSNGEKVAGFTEDQISAAARVLADRSAEACNVDKDDNWKIYGGDFIEDARAAIRALASQPAAPVQPVAWGLLSIQDPELTNDEQLAAYWSRKGREVTALYAAPTQAAPPVQQPGDVREDILAGSVDTELREKLARAIEWADEFGGGNVATSVIAGAMVATGRRLAPAAPSEEAVAIVTGSSVQWLPGAGKVADRTSLYTHPAPSSPTAPGLPAQAVPELNEAIKLLGEVIGPKAGNWYTLEKRTEEFLRKIATQVATNKPEGK